jgi:hypothetical protein
VQQLKKRIEKRDKASKNASWIRITHHGFKKTTTLQQTTQKTEHRYNFERNASTSQK